MSQKYHKIEGEPRTTLRNFPCSLDLMVFLQQGYPSLGNFLQSLSCGIQIHSHLFIIPHIHMLPCTRTCVFMCANWPRASSVYHVRWMQRERRCGYTFLACVYSLSNSMGHTCMLLDRTSSAQCEKHIQTDRSYAYIRRDHAKALDPFLSYCHRCACVSTEEIPRASWQDERRRGTAKSFRSNLEFPWIYSEERCEYKKIVIRDRVTKFLDVK